MNITLYNDGVHNTIIDVIVNFFVVVHGFSFEVALNLPETNDDLNFRRLFLKTSVDVEKHVKGNRGNFLVAFVLDHYIKGFDFELKFPLKQASISLSMQS